MPRKNNVKIIHNLCNSRAAAVRIKYTDYTLCDFTNN